MSEKLSLWDLYQKQNTMDQKLTSHTHDYIDLTGFHTCAQTGIADKALSADTSNKVKNVLTLKNTGGNNVSFDGSSRVDLSGGVYYASTAGNANHANNTDTVDSLHAHQMATLSEGGGSHGTAHVLTCKHNVDKDGMFKFMTSNSIPVKCDYANNSNIASTANQLVCTNYGTPIEVGQYIDFHQNGTNTDYSVRLIGTNGALSCSGTFSATKVYNAVWNDYAEWFERENKNEKLEAGDILSWDSKGVVKADSLYNNVIGVFSDTYGHILGGKEIENMEDNIKEYVPVGLMGRVRVKVKGKVKKGDFIILSDDTPGVGVSGEFTPGIVVGKALESHNGNQIDRILVFISTI